MKKLVLLLLFFLWAPVVHADFFSTLQIRELRSAFTDVGRYGVPRYATADLPTCGTTNKGAVAFNTTTGALTVCNGTAWGFYTAGGTMTGPLLLPDGTAAAPALSWSSDPNSGFIYSEFIWGGVTGFSAYSVGGVAKFTFGPVFAMASDVALVWIDNTDLAAGGAARFITQLPGIKTLTESAATNIAKIAIAPGTVTSGQLTYTVYAADATNHQARSGRVLYSVVNEASTETCVLGTPEEIDNTPTGTLTATVTCDTTPTDGVYLAINAVSSLIQTTLRASWAIHDVGTGSVTAQ